MIDDYIVFMDFDGTVTKGDVGYEMFRQFTAGRTQAIVDSYRRGEVNSYVCLKTECDIWNDGVVDDKAVLDYLNDQKIARGFSDYIAVLESADIRHIILSEGFDFYIDAILGSNGFGGIKRITNRASFIDGKLLPEFPYLGAGCGECSNCKGYHIKRLTDPRKSAAFIGDGHSDFHGAGAADIVFARSFLKDELKKSGRDFFEYDDFFDIIEKWKELVSRRIFTSSKRLRYCLATPGRRSCFERLWETGEVMENVGYPDGLGWSGKQYRDFWDSLPLKNFILLAIEDENGNFIGEAKLAFPDDQNICSHDLKLMPEFQGRGYGKEAWLTLFELSRRRWPDSVMVVTPNIENTNAITLYESLGFEFIGEQRKWTPPSGSTGAVPVNFRKMIRH